MAGELTSYWLARGRGVVGAKAVDPQLKATIAKVQAAATAYNGNNPIELADMASPPTLAFATTHDAALTVRANYGLNPSQMLVSPGRKYIRNAGAGQNRLYVAGPNLMPSAGDLNSLGATAYAPNLPNIGESTSPHRVGVKTASPNIEFQIPNTTADVRYYLIVDGRYVSRAGFKPTVGAGGAVETYTKLSFGSSVMRTIELEMQAGNGPLLNISVEAGYTIAAADARPLKAIFYGDSQVEAYTHGVNAAGENYFWSQMGLSNQISLMLGAACENAAIGGTGFLNRGGANNRNNILQSMDYSLADEAWDMIFLCLSQNDPWVGNSAGVRANFRASVEKARAAHPQALIVILGSYWAGPGASMLAMETDLFAQAASYNDIGIITLPRLTKAGGAPITGTGYVGATNGSGNSDVLISGDASHVTFSIDPAQSGHTVLAASDTAQLRSKIAALLT
ncbi:SGNH/GDSL hydrolase family protein [Rhizobium rhizogenes]|uniref:SGNH/GDSL hydrolase family protein n=1 Tax=Rhizobium rhizogenes TaxID=359 RepID=UPI0022BD7166|nr:SGNH/GDSL hydrolase family protein [Rhizobium rhizogenes]MCZ7480572.1 SGNH/GDSL hydrolase family protein [Rhizobium rhizogenes]